MNRVERANDRAGGGGQPLKLRAHDAEDLRAVAACLQDALVPMAEVTFLKRKRRFVMVANRFRWEAAPASTQAAARDAEPVGAAATEADARFEEADEPTPGPVYERVNCGLCFDWVRAVRVRGLDPKKRDQILNLLTVTAAPGAVTLIFSGGAEIRLEVTEIRCHMEDLGEPWPTRWQPSHEADDPADREP